MSELVEKRKASLISLGYFAVCILLYVAFIKYALPIVWPFLFAFFIAMILQKPINKLAKKTHGGKTAWSFFFVFLILLVIFGLITLAGYKVVAEISDFYKYLMAKVSNPTELINKAADWILNLSTHLPRALYESASESVIGLRDQLLSLSADGQEILAERAAENSSSFSFGSLFSSVDMSMITTPIGGIITVAQQIPSIVVAILISIIACFFLTSGYDNFTGTIKGMLKPERSEKLSNTKTVVMDVLGKWVKSYAAILFVTFCEIAIGLSILRLCGIYNGGYIAVIAACTAILDILPIFGTGTVMIPWAVISLLTHKTGLGIGLIVIYVVIFVVRQVLEPRLVSINVDMNPVITLMAMYIGLQTFGFLGLIILPITLVVIKTLNQKGIIHVWTVSEKEEKSDKPKRLRRKKRREHKNIQPANAEAANEEIANS